MTKPPKKESGCPDCGKQPHKKECVFYGDNLVRAVLKDRKMRVGVREAHRKEVSGATPDSRSKQKPPKKEKGVCIDGKSLCSNNSFCDWDFPDQCPRRKSQPLKQEDWEKEFDSEFTYLNGHRYLNQDQHAPRQLKDFISNLLAKERGKLGVEMYNEMENKIEQARKEEYHQGYVDAGTQGYFNHRDKRIRQEVLSEVEREMVGRLPAFPPIKKAKIVPKLRLFSAQDILEIINKLR